MSTSLTNVENFRSINALPLEECLAELEKYGLPRLGKYNNHWVASIEVFVTGKGVEFEVKSEFKMESPVAAANQCYERLLKALAKIKDGNNA